MKFIRLVTLLLPLVAIIFGGCSDEDDAILKASSSEVAFNHSGGEKTIIVGTDQDDWQADFTGGETDAFSFVKNADELIIKAAENNLGTVISAQITVTAGNASLIIHIVQSGQESVENSTPFFETVELQDSYHIMSVGGVVTVEFDTNTDWTATTESDWLKLELDKNANKLIMLAEANSTESILETVVNVSPDQMDPFSFNVCQYSRATDPYYSLMGKWDLYSTAWEYGGEYIYDNNYVSHASCYILEDEYNEILNMAELFDRGTSQVMYYVPESDRIIVPLGWAVKVYGYTYFFTALNLETNTASVVTLTGTISEDRNTIELEGIPAGLGFGIIMSYGTDYLKPNDKYYVASEKMRLERSAETTGEYTGLSTSRDDRDLPKLSEGFSVKISKTISIE